MRIWRKKNPERSREIVRKYQRSKKGKAVIKSHLKKIDENKKPSFKKRFLVLLKCDFRCSYCGVTAKETKLHVDHIIPLALGGDNRMDNLTAACCQCNLGKGKLSIK